MLMGMRIAEDEFSKKGTEPASSKELDADNNNLKGEEDMTRCHHHWRSFVNENYDGVLRVDTTGGSIIKGKHLKGGGQEIDFDGECRDNPHHIHIDTHEGFVYDGRIFDAGEHRFAVGTRNRFAEDRDGERTKLTDDEVWVGVKIGG
jgi:hypothetical protein